MSQWFEFRKTQTIRAKRILGVVDVVAEAAPSEGPKFDLVRGFRVRTREGELSDWIPWGYWLATDGKSYWPIAPDFMEANYERVGGS